MPVFGGRVPQPAKLALTVLLGAFGSFGVFAGTFAVLLADLSRALDLSPGPLGFALFVGAAASILAMATLGWTADRLGRRVFLVISGGVMGAGIVALAFTGGYAALLVALIILHAASGLYDVGINAAAPNAQTRVAARRMANLLFMFRTETGTSLRVVGLIVAPHFCSEHTLRILPPFSKADCVRPRKWPGGIKR
ncbi:MAG: hypothetical protein LC714_00780 [Actinobacteria bacterium]|nr:hypothetical protein [Actinomycetota bacterium]